MKSLYGQLLISLSFISCVIADDNDLWITEVVPGTGEVEVTNVGAETVVLANQYSFCHRFQYSDRIASGTSFAPGESKVFTLSFSNAADSDLWLYRSTSGYNSATNLITGLKWGPAANIGRTGLASNNSKWSGAGSFVPAPAAGMALQLTGADPLSNLNWTEGVPDLGNYSPPPEPLRLEVSLVGDQIQLDWSGGEPPYRVRSSGDLASWQSAGITEETSRTFAADQFSGRAYFQVISGVDPEPTASYRVTFRSVWSSAVFQSVPGGAHLTGIIGATHNSDVSFWRPGELATDGIESMAETGSKSRLLQEINAAIGASTGDVVLSGGGTGGNGSQTTLDFTASRTHPLVSLTSMIAPSPDWFVGVHDLSLIAANGEWIDTLSVDLFPYDSGTDSGINFTSGNANTNPPIPIARIADTPPFALQAGVKGTPPLATFVFERR